MTTVGDKPGLLGSALIGEQPRTTMIGALQEQRSALATDAEMQLGRRIPHRHPEAQADIAAAHAVLTGFEVAMQEVDQQQERAVDALRNAPTSSRDGDGESATRGRRTSEGWDTLLPRENGGPACNHVLWTIGCGKCLSWARDNFELFVGHMEARGKTPYGRTPYPALDPANLPPGMVLLTGPQAERYRALEAAANAAHEATKAVVATNTALRDAFQAFCAGVISQGNGPT